MPFPIHVVEPNEYPSALREIPHVPQRLYRQGNLPENGKRMIAVVGARKHSDYGKRACEKIIGELAGYPITIISGLAIGIDTVAHVSALNAGLTTIAVVGSGLDETVLYPKTNIPLAHQIIQNGGTLLSELPPNQRPSKQSFPARNRIMVGLAELVIAVECTIRSGTRITTRLATEYNRDVGAVPHGILSETGIGTNDLIQQGAYSIQSGADILELLNLQK